MNLLIENLNSTILNSVDINVIKTLNGELTKDDLEKELINLYYNKVIIDITAIKDYYNYSSLFDFLSFFDKSKVIILLNDNEFTNSKEFLSKLVTEGYYNFTKNAAGINYLISNPNERKDVEKYIIPNTFVNPLFAASNNTINSNNNLENTVTENENAEKYQKNPKQKVIGIQNLTSHAGSTTLMYMFIKALKDRFKVQGIEMMTQDYLYFREPDIMPCTSKEDLKMKLKLMENKEIVIIDLNDVEAYDVCDEVLFLVEPGITKLSKLMKSHKDLNELAKFGKFILNRSTLKDEEIPNFEYETKIKVYYNLANFNDRKEKIQIIDKLLAKLGLLKANQGSGLFGIFK